MASKKKFSEMSDAKEIVEYLKKVLGRPGMKKETASLFHYSSIEKICKIIDGGYLWLGSTADMNDYLEHVGIQDNSLYFISFSKAEENMGMYKMYAPGPQGVMMRISFETAEQIKENLPRNKSGKYLVNVVKKNKVTDEQVEADVYWTSVCYKKLHSDMIQADSVKNNQIKSPLNNSDLAGFIKLFGWEYEKEVRLCARVNKQLDRGDKIAIKLPEDFSPTIVTGPEFVKANNKYYAELFKKEIDMRNSAYEGLVNLGNH